MSEFEPQYPATVRLTGETFAAWERMHLLVDQAFRAANKSLQDTFIPLVRSRNDVSLPSIRAEKVELKSMALETLDGSRASADNHSVVAVYMDVFDSSDKPTSAADEPLGPVQGYNFNTYTLVTGVELPPVLVQSEQLESFNQASWQACNKHLLSDQEAEQLITLIHNAQADPEAAVAID